MVKNKLHFSQNFPSVTKQEQFVFKVHTILFFQQIFKLFESYEGNLKRTGIVSHYHLFNVKVYVSILNLVFSAKKKVSFCSRKICFYFQMSVIKN